jgi:hypothetical protein
VGRGSEGGGFFLFLKKMVSNVLWKSEQDPNLSLKFIVNVLHLARSLGLESTVCF